MPATQAAPLAHASQTTPLAHSTQTTRQTQPSADAADAPLGIRRAAHFEPADEVEANLQPPLVEQTPSDANDAAPQSLAAPPSTPAPPTAAPNTAPLGVPSQTAPPLQGPSSRRQSPAGQTDVRFLQSPPPAARAFPLQTPAPPSPSFPALRENVPLGGLDDTGQVSLTNNNNGRISLVVRDAPLNKVLAVIAQQLRLNVVSSSDTASANVNITLENVPLDDALSSILSVHGYTWVRNHNIIHVTSTAALSTLAPETQGRRMRVFPLHYALAADVEPVVRGLMSPVGKAFHTASSPADNRKTRETLVVEDLPGYLDRIAEFIAFADVPPRQVLIEAHLLQIDLKDQNRHGVNLKYLSQLGGHKLQFQLQGMADAKASPGILFTFTGSDLDSLIELLKSTTDSKTLASPRVLVVNGQEARIQIGAQLGFRVTTTTQTSTLQSVNFLDVGVVLRVTPRISPTGKVLMHVKPEVSSGSVNTTTGLPEEETTEVETDILLDSGQGVVIGGLIQEKAKDTQNKLPLLGDLPLVGRLFQQRQNDKERSEIVIALVPRVVPYDPAYQMSTDSHLYRATSPILDCQLRRLPRDDGYMLHDACNNPIRPCRVFRLPPVDCCPDCPNCPPQTEVLPQEVPLQEMLPPDGLPQTPPAGLEQLPPPR